MKQELQSLAPFTQAQRLTIELVGYLRGRAARVLVQPRADRLASGC